MSKLTAGQQEVLEVLEDFGPLPDVALVPLTQHVAMSHQSSSSIRSRRAELARAGLVEAVGERKMPSGRKAQVFGAVT